MMILNADSPIDTTISSILFFQTSNFNSVTLELAESIEEAIPDHIARWSGQVGPGLLINGEIRLMEFHNTTPHV